MPRRCALAPLAITHLNVLFPRPPSRHPRPASHPLDSPRVVLLHLRRRAPPAAVPPLPPSPPFLLAPSPLFRGFSRRPTSFSRLPSFRSLRRTERGGHDTCQSTADARSIPTDPRLLSPALLRLFLRPTADNCHPSSSPSPFPPSPLAPRWPPRTLQRTFYECWRCMLG